MQQLLRIDAKTQPMHILYRMQNGVCPAGCLASYMNDVVRFLGYELIDYERAAVCTTRLVLS